MPQEKLGEQYEFTSPVQLYYAGGLFKPTTMPNVANAEPKYNAWFIFDQSHPDYTPLVTLFGNVAMFKLRNVKFCKMPLFPEEEEDEEIKAAQNPGRKHPLASGYRLLEIAELKGKSTETLGHLKDKVVLMGRSGEQYPPRLGGNINGVARDFDGPMRDAQRNQFYNGVLVYPKVYIRVYEAFGGGVSCRISSVFSIGEGERLAGGEGSTAIPTGYKPHSGHSTNSDPFDNDEFTGRTYTKSELDDEIPF